MNLHCTQQLAYRGFVSRIKVGKFHLLERVPRPLAGRLQASKGFDQKTSAPPKKADKKASKLERYLDIEELKDKQAAGWVRVVSLQELTSKPLKPVILPSGKAVVVYKVNEDVYCSEANSTAFKYPLHDGNILQTKSGPAIEVPLDGTTYALESGKVLSWCPKNNPVRRVLGAMKDKTEPIDLQVFPAEVRGAEIFVKFD